jgi:hypothetical protein
MLTLEQVKKAGRFAWIYTFIDHIFIPGTGFLRRNEDQNWEPEDPAYFLVDEATGWHHLPGCDCEFCRRGQR